MRKFRTILFWGQSKHLLQKNNLQDSFLNAILTFFQKHCLIGLSMLSRTISLLGLLCFSSILEVLTI